MVQDWSQQGRGSGKRESEVRSALLPNFLGKQATVELLNSAHIRAGREREIEMTENPWAVWDIPG
jgi:hypothetical protein